MNEYLSIGQMAKLNNVSVQALRHYEKLGLMVPSYINNETGYRYYSIKDFATILASAMGIKKKTFEESVSSSVENMQNQTNRLRNISLSEKKDEE